MEEQFYTIKRLSEITGIPESTVRYYRDRYPDYFHHTGRGRKKRYKKEALDALRLIAEASKRSLTAEETRELLDTEIHRFIDVEKETAVTTATTQQQLNDSYLPILEMIANQDERLKRLEKQEEQIQKLEEEMYELKTSVSIYKKRRKKSFLEKLFRK